MKKYFFLLLFFFAFNAHAVIYTSSDNQFTIDMPSGWARTVKADSVLFLKKGTAQIEFKTVPECESEACLDQKIQDDLTAVKAKKMKIVGNSYTGEEIKKIDFSTGEHVVYINFSSPKMDFSAGYFMFNGHAYSVLTQNMSYADTDLIFSFISPIEQPKAKKEAYDTYALPSVESAEIASVTLKEESKAQVQENKIVTPSATIFLQKAKRKVNENRDFTFVSKEMPSYIRSFGRAFDVLVLLFGLYLLVFAGALLVKIIYHGRPPRLRTNPASAYPIKFARLYGTPSLIFSAKDNQGSSFVSFSTRWSGMFMFMGLALVVFTCLFMCVLRADEVFGVYFTSYARSSIYSFFALVIPLGLFIYAVGLFIKLISPAEFTIYNQSGKKAVYILQKGFSVKQEAYTVYYAHSDDTFRLIRKKFSLKRRWDMVSESGEEVATFIESSAVKSIFRRCFGHLWGILRASYSVTGPLESKGFVHNHNTMFNEFTANIDKPQAIDALEMMVAALVINIRDMDKYYPWIN